MTNLDYIRKRLLKDIPEEVKFKFKSIKDTLESQWSYLFIRYMQNRMIFGAFRYGNLNSQKACKVKYDNIDSVRKRLVLYENTGNTEYLVDCANLCMIEFMIGNHPKKHFKAVDDGVHAEKINE